MKKAPRLPGLDFTLRNKLNKLKDRTEPKDDSNNFVGIPPALSAPLLSPSDYIV